MSDNLYVRAGGRGETSNAWVTVPTISKLRVALDEMQAAGVSEHSPLTIHHRANPRGTFVIRERNPLEVTE